MAIPLILSSVIIAMILALLAVYAYKKGKKGAIKPWTPENWLEFGAIFLLLHYIMSFFERDIFILGSLGTIYVTIGLFGKYVTKDKKMNEKQRKNLTIGLSVLVLLGVVVFFTVSYLAK